jgi:hypothetical protein
LDAPERQSRKNRSDCLCDSQVLHNIERQDRQPKASQLFLGDLLVLFKLLWMRGGILTVFSRKLKLTVSDWMIEIKVPEVFKLFFFFFEEQKKLTGTEQEDVMKENTQVVNQIGITHPSANKKKATRYVNVWRSAVAFLKVMYSWYQPMVNGL